MKQKQELTLESLKERSREQGIYPNVVLDFTMLETLLRNEFKRIMPEKNEDFDDRFLSRETVASIEGFNEAIDQMTENIEKEGLK